jgi:hypothetical protein
MSATTTLKAGDTARPITDTLSIVSGSALDLTGCTVKFVTRNRRTDVRAEYDGEVTDATGGAVKVDVLANPAIVSATTGAKFNCSWVVTFANGAKLTVPTVGFEELVVEPAL